MWMMLRVPPQRFAAVRQRFEAAGRASAPSAGALAVLERWARDPEAPVADGSLRRWDPFIGRGYERLACELLHEQAEDDPDPFLGSVAINRIRCSTVASVARLAGRYDPHGDDLTAGVSDPQPYYVAVSLGEAAVVRAIREAVVPWALGYEDPLRERAGR